jgi:hypothetical protein
MHSVLGVQVVTQVVEHRPSKQDTLSSNSNNTKAKTKFPKTHYMLVWKYHNEIPNLKLTSPNEIEKQKLPCFSTRLYAYTF